MTSVTGKFGFWLRLSDLWMAICVLLAGAVPSYATTTYYVRSSGSDSSDGLTPATAFLTPAKAASVVAAGSTVYVGAGNYSCTNLKPVVTGTSTGVIKFVADTAGTFTGDAGAVRLTASGSGVSAISLFLRNYVQFIGFELAGTDSPVVLWTRSNDGLLQDCEILAGTDNGIRIFGSLLTVHNCRIRNVSGRGVAISKYWLSPFTQSNVTITDTVIHDIGTYGVEIYDATTLTISGCELYNTAIHGVALTSGNPTITIRQSIIRNAQWGVHLGDWANVTIANCLIHSMDYQGVYMSANASFNVSIWNTTFYGMGEDGVMMENGTAQIHNCIFADNTKNGIKYITGTINHTHNLFHNNGADYFGLSPGSGEFNADPLFINAPSDFQLQASSPAKDAGTDASAVTSIDLLSVTRPAGAGWDIGCYELGVASQPRIKSWTQVQPD